jgi:hypothetical protein
MKPQLWIPFVMTCLSSLSHTAEAMEMGWSIGEMGIALIPKL